MIYTIKAIPTIYNNVQFRSRLEARWAAFFDLSGIEWDYEPFDLDGWTPDFLLRAGGVDMLSEVKPIDFTRDLDTDGAEACEKAILHRERYNIVLLGISPISDNSIGVPIERCPVAGVKGSIEKWRLAGNQVQWLPDERPEETYYDQMRRIFRRRAA
ncbi:hypothetical protein HJB67_13015 [Rhizobium lentis]|uniref:hypothetical protein n=1 Tax=Rhizobium lentis TaxID=1138194 RepID=UPI001C83913E|nr:hypothetical protein [Rhizobium lentis]MBX5010876.1 hypothetical protein [Rhizobium lentis]